MQPSSLSVTLAACAPIAPALTLAADAWMLDTVEQLRSGWHDLWRGARGEFGFG